MNIIEIKNLKKYFKDVKAVDDISFRVEEGELFAFLGLNGAGKSTTISIICGLLQKDGGEITVNGKNIDTDSEKIKYDIGIVFQNTVLDKALSARQNLKTRAALYGICGKVFDERLCELDKMLRLSDILDRPIGKLSGGQKRRIDVARALLAKPKILILDEPTTGLDPQSRIMVWSVIENLRKTDGLTVFLTTHYMEEAAEADYVVILDSGKIAAAGTPHDLKNEFSGDYIKLYDADENDLKAKNIDYINENGYLKITVKSTAEAKQMIIENSDVFNDFEIIKGKMDDVFLNATGKQAKEEE